MICTSPGVSVAPPLGAVLPAWEVVLQRKLGPPGAVPVEEAALGVLLHPALRPGDGVIELWPALVVEQRLPAGKAQSKGQPGDGGGLCSHYHRLAVLVQHRLAAVVPEDLSLTASKVLLDALLEGSGGPVFQRSPAGVLRHKGLLSGFWHGKAPAGGGGGSF